VTLKLSHFIGNIIKFSKYVDATNATQFGRSKFLKLAHIEKNLKILKACGEENQCLVLSLTLLMNKLLHTFFPRIEFWQEIVHRCILRDFPSS